MSKAKAQEPAQEKWTPELVIMCLGKSRRFVERSLTVLRENQYIHQSSAGTDQFLWSVSEYLARKGFITPRQEYACRKSLEAYANTLAELAQRAGPPSAGALAYARPQPVTLEAVMAVPQVAGARQGPSNLDDWMDKND